MTWRQRGAAGAALVAALVVVAAALALELLPAARFAGAFRLVSSVPATVPMLPQRPGATWLYHQARVELGAELGAPLEASLWAQMPGPAWLGWRVEDAAGRRIEARWSRRAHGEEVSILARDGARGRVLAATAEGPAEGLFVLRVADGGCRIEDPSRARVLVSADCALEAPLRLTLATGSEPVRVRSIEARGVGGRHAASATGGPQTVALAVAWLGLAAGLVRLARRGVDVRPAALALVAAALTFSPRFPVLLPALVAAVAVASALGATLLAWARGPAGVTAGVVLAAALSAAPDARAGEAARLGVPVRLELAEPGPWALELELAGDTVAEVTPLPAEREAFPRGGWPAVVTSGRPDLTGCVARIDRHSVACIGERLFGRAGAHTVRVRRAGSRTLELSLDGTRGVRVSFDGELAALQLKVLSGGPAEVAALESGAAPAPEGALRWWRWSAPLAAAAAVTLGIVAVAGRASVAVRAGVVILALGLGLLPRGCSTGSQPIVPTLQAREHHPLGWYGSRMRSGAGALLTEGRFRVGAPRADTEGCARVLALGSSSTWGTGVEADETYAARLEELLLERRATGGEDRCVTVVNAGKPGTWSTPVAALYRGLHRQLGARVVTVNLANNDRIAPLAADAPEQLLRSGEARLDWMVIPVLLDPTAYRRMVRDPDGARARRLEESLMRLGAAVRDEGATLVLVPEPTAAWMEAGRDPHARYADAVRSAARRLDMPLVDVGVRLATEHRHDDLFLDDVHLTPHGHALVAELLAPVVDEALGGAPGDEGDASVAPTDGVTEGT